LGAFQAYASRFGQALINWLLYLPEAWAKDGERRTHVPEDVAFASKPEIAHDLIAAALDAQAPCTYVLV
jgi:SRSO17 transposase